LAKISHWDRVFLAGKQRQKTSQKNPVPMAEKSAIFGTFFFRKIWRKTLKKKGCYDINYIGKIDKIFELKNGGKTC